MSFQVLFTPDLPHRRAIARKLCDYLGYGITSDTQAPFHVAIKWRDRTFSEGSLGIPSDDAPITVLNAECTDISKQKVAETFQDVFGYSLSVDPTTHDGVAVRKSNFNARHDGVVIGCPIPKTALESDHAYEKLIDSRINRLFARTLRVPVYGQEIPLVYFNDREVSKRFRNECVRTSMGEVDDVFSREEQTRLIEFSQAMGMDFGELDVLRDSDARIYVVDANNTPFGPPPLLPDSQKVEATERLATSFSRLLRASGRSENRKIIVIQSCDEGYFKVLDVTSKANARYASRHGYGYRAEVGNLCPIPNTGNWNRYILLKQEIESGVYDWAFWMDADAVVRDQEATLESIIDRTPDKALIACSGGGNVDYNINNGVFLLNLRHPVSKALVNSQLETAHRLDSRGNRFQADQPSMQNWLRLHGDVRGQIHFLKRYANKEHDLFNYDGAFVCHVLRQHGDLQARRAKLLQVVEESSVDPGTGI